MQITTTIAQLKNLINGYKKQGKTIGFVPTMGALHKGHISLIKIAQNHCDIVVASIFVNPTQFNDLNDLKNYPRTIERDTNFLKEVSCDILFAPEVNEIYTTKELEFKKNNVLNDSWKQGKNIDFGALELVMEGAHRPGHFNGVAQVVSKLFNIVDPDKAFFGKKDYQQLAIIKSMVAQFNLNIQIIECPIVREPNGLAMSSRNERLTENEKNKATLISKTLFKINELNNTGNYTVKDLKNKALQMLSEELAFSIEYFEIAHKNTLIPLNESLPATNAVAFIALKLGNVRLIDNIELK